MVFFQHLIRHCWARTSLSRQTLLLAFMAALSACTVPPAVEKNYPMLQVLGRRGELLCMVNLKTGLYNLTVDCSRTVKPVYFRVVNPREGIYFGFARQKLYSVCNHKDYFYYDIVDPVHGAPTEILIIDAVKGMVRDIELVPGILSGQPGMPDGELVLSDYTCLLVVNNND